MISLRTLVLAGFAFIGAACSCAPDDACRQEYGNCESAAECGEGASCEHLGWDHGEGDICARSCDTELDCEREGGRGPRCLDVGRTGAFRCYAGCLTNLHCPSGWACQPISTGGGVCLP
jgi:hypothetical protein